MIGLLLLYFIGKAYFELARDYNKAKWLFVIIGIAAYYAGTFLGGIVLGVIQLLTDNYFTETMPKILLNLIALPFGVLCCWGLYKILKTQWSKQSNEIASDVIDSNIV